DRTILTQKQKNPFFFFIAALGVPRFVRRRSIEIRMFLLELRMQLLEFRMALFQTRISCLKRGYLAPYKSNLMPNIWLARIRINHSVEIIKVFLECIHYERS